jgi:hypothetical protein
MTFLLALCVIALAFAQDTSPPAPTTVQTTASSAPETTGAASSSASTAGETTTGVVGTVQSCAERIAACQAASEKCGNNLEVLCGCKKAEAACLTKIADSSSCSEQIDELKESVEYTCFQVGCGLDCSQSQLGCNLAGIAVNCPASLSGCRKKATTPAAKCDCEASYFKCVSSSSGCADYNKVFTEKAEECRKTCPFEKCQVSGASAVVMAPIATIVAAIALMISN